MPAPVSPHAVTILNLLQLLAPAVAALQGWLLTAPLGVFSDGAVAPTAVVFARLDAFEA